MHRDPPLRSVRGVGGAGSRVNVVGPGGERTIPFARSTGCRDRPEIDTTLAPEEIMPLICPPGGSARTIPTSRSVIGCPLPSRWYQLLRPWS